MKNIDLVIETLNKDSNCSKYMLDWIINRIHDQDFFNNDWELVKIDGGYNLSKNDIYSFDYYYMDFI